MTHIALDRREFARKAASHSAVSERYEVLDSWRGISALLVALFHFQVNSPIAESPFIRSAFLFVDFFFVLSGFVIASGYSHRLATAVDIRRFVLVRFGRLYPLHLAVLLALVCFEFARLALPQLRGDGAPLFADSTDPWALVPNLLLLNGTGIMDANTWNGVSWSISTEFCAYLFFAAAMFFLGARSWLALLGVVLAGPVVLLAVSPHYMDATYDYGLIRCLYGFAVGALLFRFCGEGIRTARCEFSAAGPAAVSLWSVAELAMIALIAAFVSTAGREPAGVAAPFVFALALYVFAHEGGIISWILKARVFLWLGAVSYSIYMLHLFVQGRMTNAGRLLDKYTGTNLIGDVTLDGSVSMGFAVSSAAEGVAVTLVMIALLLGAAAVTYRFVEMPSLNWFRRRAKALK